MRLKNNLFPLLITAVVVFLFIVNYVPGTYLTGWDNLQTELNPTLAIKRAFFSVWQEYQSFGLPAGMGHAADLVRAIYVWILTFIMPQNIVRYFFQFSMLLVGTLGVHKLLQMTLQTNVIARSETTKQSRDESFNLTGIAALTPFARNDTYAFFGALFYLLNLGSVQIMGLPFESFSVFYASLPWCIWIFIAMSTGAVANRALYKRNLLLFFFINILATPLAVSQQLFVVYILVLGTIGLGVIIEIFFNKNEVNNIKKGIPRQARNDKMEQVAEEEGLPTPHNEVSSGGRETSDRIWNSAQKVILLFLIIFAINSFWLLPQIYFLKTSGNVVQSAKVNQIATEDVYYSNFEKGTIPNFLSLQGFFFDRVGRNNTFLFQAWHESQKNPLVAGTIILFSIIPLVGFFHKSRYSLPFFLLYLLCMAAILIATLPFNLINEFMRQNGFLNQVFRSPFTKFIIPYSLVTSYFFASGLIVIFNLLQKLIVLNCHSEPIRLRSGQASSRDPFRKRFLHALTLGRNDKRSILNFKQLLSIILFIFIFVYSFPAFTGNYIAPEVKVKIPNRYFELMDYFKHVDKNKRIALLPEYTFWGWYFNKWGYDGSGFLWYGIEQPIVSRTFDVWSTQSEGYLWEMKAAAEAEDKIRFEKVLEKYDIDYLILDESLLPVSSTLKGMQFDRMEKILTDSEKVSLVKNWQDLKLYQVKLDKKIQNYVSLSTSLPNIGPLAQATNNDIAYADYGDYQSNTSTPFQVYYPFLDLITQTHLQDKKWDISEDENNFYITSKLQINPSGNTMSNVPLCHSDQALARGGISFERDPSTALRSARDDNCLNINIKNNLLTVTFPKIIYNNFDIKKTRVTNCSFVKELKSAFQDNNLLITTKDGAIACFEYNNPYLEQNISYIVKVDNNNLKGRSMFFYILDQTKKQAFIEDRFKNKIEYYILPQRYNYGTGYYFSFQNTSYGGTTSSNKLRNVSIFSFPNEQITNLKFVCRGTPPGCSDGLPGGVVQKAKFTSDFTAQKINYFLYEVALPHQLQTLVLNQSFHPGWEAYYLPTTATAAVRKLLMTYFPYFFGEKITPHFSVNNWANGWNIDPNVDSNTIILIFWPQYLEFVGFIILVISCLFIVRVPYRSTG